MLVCGFEKMAPGALGSNFSDRRNPLDRAVAVSNRIHRPENQAERKAPFAAKMFGDAAREYMVKYGVKEEDFVEVARVNHMHSKKNPYAQNRREYEAKEIEESAEIYDPLTKLQCCPNGDGAAAAVVVSEAWLEKRADLMSQAVEIVGHAMMTDGVEGLSGSAMSLVGYEMVQRAGEEALERATVGIEKVKIAEVHDCFTTNEILVIDALGLCGKGKAGQYVRSGQATFGSKKAVVNPSGGLISKGHPPGATGIAQCAELVWQLRGWANNRLVDVREGEVALQQNAGLNGACVVAVLKRADGKRNRSVGDEVVQSMSKWRYNPAIEVMEVVAEEIKSVRSLRFNEWAVGDDATVRARI